MFQQDLNIGVEQVLLQQDGEIGPERGEKIGDKDAIGEEFIDIHAVTAEKFLLE